MVIGTFYSSSVDIKSEKNDCIIIINDVFTFGKHFHDCIISVE
jgi:hypothetical protein